MRGRVTAIAVMQHQVLLCQEVLPIPQLGEEYLEYQVLPFLLVHLEHQSLLPYNLQHGQGPFQILTSKSHTPVRHRGAFLIERPCIESGTGRPLAELIYMNTDHPTNTPNKYTRFVLVYGT